jgi:FkbM family methyltransferase
MAAVAFSLGLGARHADFVMDDCGGLDHIVALVRRDGLAAYEAPYPLFAAAAIATTPGAVLDIGANTGLFALLAAAVRPDAVVHAFEPLGWIVEVLQANVALNPALSDRVHIHRVALSDYTGVATFYETVNPYGLFPTSSTLDATFGASHGETRRHETPTARLDDVALAHGIDSAAFVKIDVEGHEKEALIGAAGFIARHRPLLGVELLSTNDFVFMERFLAANRYVDAVLTPGRMAIGRAPAFVPEGWNHVFVPEERIGQAKAIALAIGLAFD